MSKKKNSLGGWLIIIFIIIIGAAHSAFFVIGFVGMIIYWVIKKISVNNNPTTPKVHITVSRGILGNDSDDCRKRNPGYLAKSRVADDLWISPGQAVKVGKFTIPGGMIYVGRGLAAVADHRGDEPALIDPQLQVASKNPDYQGNSMTYYPYYSGITPVSRLAYLDWLANGRNKPDISIGYVFLFFYGLERRLLFEAQRSVSAKSDATAIISEVRRLLAIYGHSKSFKNYASRFIEVSQILFDGNRVYENEPTYETRGGEYPYDVKLALSQLVADGKPIPEKWALAWYLGSPTTRLRKPATRCQTEFRQLFQLRYKKIHGNGMAIQPNKTRLKLEYRPASASFRGSLNIPVPDLPDVTALSRPLNQLITIAEDCYNDLDPYSRWLDKNPDKPKHPAGLGQLPQDLLSQLNYKEMNSIFERLNGLLKGQTIAVVEGSKIIASWPSTTSGQMTKKETTGLLQLLEKARLGIEPDVRFGGSTISSTQKVVLFKLPEEYPTTPSTEYKAAVVLLRIAAAVAAADGSVDKTEEAHLQHHLETALNLSHGERIRLNAYWKWLVETTPRLTGLKTRLEQLDKSSKQVLANFAVDVAGADGIIDPGEIKTVRSIYKLLEMDPEQVFGDIHAMTVGTPSPAVEPVTVRKAKPGPVGFSIPQSPKTEVQRQPEFQLDKNIIAAKMAETAAVSNLLSEIFIEESSVDLLAKISDSFADTPTVANLDRSHSGLLKALFKKGIWTRSEFEKLAAEYSLLPDGAIDTINEAAFELCDEPVLEGDDPIEINLELMEDMSA